MAWPNLAMLLHLRNCPFIIIEIIIIIIILLQADSKVKFSNEFADTWR